MSDTPKYTLSIGLAPTAQFAKGAMLVARDETVTGLIAAFADLFEDDGLAKALVQEAFKKEAAQIVAGAPAQAAPSPPQKTWNKPAAPAPATPAPKPWESRGSGPAPSNGKASEAQVKMLFAVIGDLGWSLDDGAEYIGQQLGLDSSPRLKELSKADASKAIDSLRSFQNAQ